jgi:hypothetical protein
MLFCECGQGNMVPWESTAAEPAPSAAPPPTALPAAPALEPVSFDRDRDRRGRSPGARSRRRVRYTPDPNFCLNHENTPSQKTCPDCGESFCNDCTLVFQGVQVCGPCKNYRVRALQEPRQLSTLALVSLILALVAGPLALCLITSFGSSLTSSLVLAAHAVPLVMCVLALRHLAKNPKLTGRSLVLTGIMMAALTASFALVLTIFGPGVWS